MRRSRSIVIAAVAVLGSWANGFAQKTVSVPESVVAYPSMIVYNGKVVTMDDPTFGLNTPIGKTVQGMAIRDGRIMALGTNDEIVAMAGPQTDKIDLKG